MHFIPDVDKKNPDNVWKDNVCKHPEHLPPAMWCPAQSGTWVCPACGVKTRVELPNRMTVNNLPIFSPENFNQAQVSC